MKKNNLRNGFFYYEALNLINANPGASFGTSDVAIYCGCTPRHARRVMNALAKSRKVSVKKYPHAFYYSAKKKAN